MWCLWRYLGEHWLFVCYSCPPFVLVGHRERNDPASKLQIHMQFLPKASNVCSSKVFELQPLPISISPIYREQTGKCREHLRSVRFFFRSPALHLFGGLSSGTILSRCVPAPLQAPWSCEARLGLRLDLHQSNYINHAFPQSSMAT